MPVWQLQHLHQGVCGVLSPSRLHSVAGRRTRCRDGLSRFHVAEHVLLTLDWRTHCRPAASRGPGPLTSKGHSVKGPVSTTHIASFLGPHPKRGLRPSVRLLLHRNLCAVGTGKSQQFCRNPPCPSHLLAKCSRPGNDLTYEPCSSFTHTATGFPNTVSRAVEGLTSLPGQ